MISRDADKQFYLVLIRHFHKESPLLQPNYVPPKTPKKEQDSQFLSEAALNCYQNALKDMPQLIRGKRGKTRPGGILSSLSRPKTIKVSVQEMRKQLEDKNAEINSLIVASQMN